MGDIFVLGLDEFNRHRLERADPDREHRFHGVLDPHRILEGTEYPIDELIAEAEAIIREAATPVDGIIGYVDFPVSTMLPLLARRFDLPAVTLEALLKCEHKYWSRLEQRSVVPDHIPDFQLFDPFDPASVDAIDLSYPYWVKPVKSAGSYLGFRVQSRRQLEYAVARIQEGIRIFSDPFERVLARADLPPAIADAGADQCLAESLIGGHQCTLEGAVRDGEIRFHGMIDSVRIPNQSSFQRYQYPSQLPETVQERMRDLAARVLGRMGVDHTCVNIEFFWDDNADHVWLLEVNPRIAQHHSDLFEKVDGASNHRVAIDVALGRPIDLPHRAGTFRHAACCWIRTTADGVVTRVPSDEEIATLAGDVPGLAVDVHVHEGQRLSELTHQDSYSYVLGLFYIGADDPDALEALERRCRELLRFEILQHPNEGP